MTARVALCRAGGFLAAGRSTSALCTWKPCIPSPPHPQVAIAWMHLTRQVHTGYLSIACALQCILLLFRRVHS